MICAGRAREDVGIGRARRTHQDFLVELVDERRRRGQDEAALLGRHASAGAERWVLAARNAGLAAVVAGSRGCECGESSMRRLLRTVPGLAARAAVRRRPKTPESPPVVGRVARRRLVLPRATIRRAAVERYDPKSLIRLSHPCAPHPGDFSRLRGRVSRTPPHKGKVSVVAALPCPSSSRSNRLARRHRPPWALNARRTRAEPRHRPARPSPARSSPDCAETNARRTRAPRPTSRAPRKPRTAAAFG